MYKSRWIKVPGYEVIRRERYQRVKGNNFVLIISGNKSIDSEYVIGRIPRY